MTKFLWDTVYLIFIVNYKSLDPLPPRVLRILLTTPNFNNFYEDQIKLPSEEIMLL